MSPRYRIIIYFLIRPRLKTSPFVIQLGKALYKSEQTLKNYFSAGAGKRPRTNLFAPRLRRVFIIRTRIYENRRERRRLVERVRYLLENLFSGIFESNKYWYYGYCRRHIQPSKEASRFQRWNLKLKNKNGR